MGNWRDAIPSKYLKAGDLDGHPCLVTIKGVAVERMNDGKKAPVATFVEAVGGEHKGFVLNVTNCKSIESISGSKDTDNWKGTHIVIYPTETEMGGERVDCVRVRAPKPGAKLPPKPVVEDSSEENLRDDFVPDDSDVPF
jgi:hypothetical protein